MPNRLSTLLLATSALLVCQVGEITAAKPSVIKSNDSPVDLLYLVRDRLIVIRMHVRIDTKSSLTVWNEFVGGLFRDLDVNEDNALTGNEIRAIPSLTLRATRRSLSTPTRRKTAEIDPRDGKVTRAGLASYLKRAGAGPFAIRITRPDRRPLRTL